MGGPKILILNIMKKTLVLLILLVLASCGKDPKNEQAEETLPEPTAADSVPTEESSLYIKDRSLYSQGFLAGLDEEGYSTPLKIIDNYVVVEGDTVYFPAELKQNQDYRFTGFTDTHFYQLVVKRINITAIEYDFAVFQKEKPIYSSKGRADLNSYFFLAAESLEDSDTGTAYGAHEYSKIEGDCGFVVTIGTRDDEGRLRATAYDFCDEIQEQLGGGESITLRESK